MFTAHTYLYCLKRNKHNIYLVYEGLHSLQWNIKTSEHDQ